jgi:hypothetical protein
MYPSSFDSVRFETRQRHDSRMREASTERLAHELRGTTATTRVRKHARERWAAWLHRPALVRVSLLGARVS